MRSYVLRDPALARHAGRFVWLSIDIDKDENAAFLQRFPVMGVPTFLVIDPTAQKVVLTRASGMDVRQFVALFDEGERAFRGLSAAPADAAFAEGQALTGSGDDKKAAEAFQRALAQAPPDWPRRRAALEALVMARQSAGDERGCAKLAVDESARGPHDPVWLNLVISGLYCAPDDPEVVAALAPRARQALDERLEADDRSSLYEVLVMVEKDPAKKKALAGEWIGFLEKEAARAKTPQERASFDAHRLEAAIELGDPNRALPALLASERDLPGDYNGPARLAIAYQELGRYDDALAACERALKLAYGPRRLRIEETHAKILQKKGDVGGARRVLDEAIRAGEALPKTTRAASEVERLKKQRAELR